MTNRTVLLGGALVLAAAVVCCAGVILGAALVGDRADNEAGIEADLRSVPGTTPGALEDLIRPGEAAGGEPSPAPEPTVAATAPRLTPLPQTGDDAAAQLQALIEYAQSIKPMLDEGVAAAQRDGQILEQSKADPGALCAGAGAPHPTLEADARLTENLARQLRQVQPTAETARLVHRPLLESFTLWGEALDNINRSCRAPNQAERELRRLGAGLQLAGSMLNFHVASDNFWRLVLVNGLEALVGPPPSS